MNAFRPQRLLCSVAYVSFSRPSPPHHCCVIVRLRVRLLFPVVGFHYSYTPSNHLQSRYPRYVWFCPDLNRHYNRVALTGLVTQPFALSLDPYKAEAFQLPDSAFRQAKRPVPLAGRPQFM